MWEGKPTCVGETDVCETTVTHKPLSTTIHDTIPSTAGQVNVPASQGAAQQGGASGGRASDPASVHCRFPRPPPAPATSSSWSPCGGAASGTAHQWRTPTQKSVGTALHVQMCGSQTVEHSKGDTFNILFCVTGQREGYVASARSGQGSRYSPEQSTCARGGGGLRCTVAADDQHPPQQALAGARRTGDAPPAEAAPPRPAAA